MPFLTNHYRRGKQAIEVLAKMCTVVFYDVKGINIVLKFLVQATCSYFVRNLLFHPSNAIDQFQQLIVCLHCLLGRSKQIETPNWKCLS